MGRRLFVPALVLVIAGLPVGEGHAADPPAISTVVQQWDLLAGARSDAVGGTIVDIYRGPFGGTALSPVPTVEFVVAGFLSGAAGGGAWDVELRDGSNEVLGTVRFTADDDVVALKQAAVTWPTIATELATLKLVKFGSPLNPGGTLHMTKAHLRLSQDGTISASVGKLPLAARQVVPSTSWTDVADPILYEHSLAGFDPLPTVSLRVGGQGVSYPMSAHVRMVDVSTGSPVAEIEFFGMNSPRSLTSGTSLEVGKTYRLQAKTSEVGWSILSADLEFSQSTVDPRGLTSVVAWYAMTTTPTNLSVDGVRTEHLIAPPINDAEVSGLDWITVAKRISGAGEVSADLVSSGASESLGVGLSVSSSSYTLKSSPVPPPALGGDWWDTKAVLGAGTTGRLAGTILRHRLRLRDTITSLDASRESFSPIAPPYDDRTQISGNIHPDAGQSTWHLSIVSDVNEEVAHATGSSLDPIFVWDAVDLATGFIVSDGVYTASLTLEEWPKVLRQKLITVDATGPRIGRMSILPRDHGNTHYLSQPLLAKITDATTGVDPETIEFTLLDETDQTQDPFATTHLAASYDPLTGWAKTSPVALQEDHLYRIEVEALDAVGNLGIRSQRPVTDGGGFMAMTASPDASTASIPSTPCTVSEVDPITQTRAVTCESVPLILADTSITLSATRRASFGYVDHVAALGEAVLSGTAIGAPVTQPAYESSAEHLQPLRFSVGEPSWTSQTHTVDGHTAELGPLEAEVPGAWDTNVSVVMTSQSTTAQVPTCADPAAESGPVLCLPDPVWSMYEVIVDEALEAQAVANDHAASFGVTILDVFDDGAGGDADGYWGLFPLDTAFEIAGATEVTRIAPRDKSYNNVDVTTHVEVRPPSAGSNGTAYLTCGWHDSCEDADGDKDNPPYNYPLGRGLDYGGKTASGDDHIRSYLRTFGWAYEEDVRTGEVQGVKAPHDAGQVRIDENADGCNDIRARMWPIGEDPEGSTPTKVWYQHLDVLADPDVVHVFRAGQDAHWLGYGDPQFRRVFVGEEDNVAPYNCGASQHSHIDLLGSHQLFDPDRPLRKMKQNERIRTATECKTETGHAGCSMTMSQPETPPERCHSCFGMLTIEAEHHPIFWWDWVENACEFSIFGIDLCAFVEQT